jgi:hypothetical protein
MIEEFDPVSGKVLASLLSCLATYLESTIAEGCARRLICAIYDELPPAHRSRCLDSAQDCCFRGELT